MSYRKKHIKPKIRNLEIKKKFFKRPLLWIFSGILITIIFVFYFILFFSKFQISKIDISGNEKIKSNDIENIAWLVINKKVIDARFFDISSKSIFIADKKKLEKEILKKFPGIEEVSVQKSFPQNISLKIKERKPFAVFCRTNALPDEKCFFIDKIGVIFEELQNIPEETMVMSKELKDSEISVGKNIIEKNIMDMVFEVEKNLNNFQINVKDVLISNPLIFKTSEGWQIYFDPDSNINLQIAKMNILLEDEILPDKRKNLQYIYLHYKDRAYYK